MSSVVVVTPLIIAGWPVITAAVTAAVGSLGFSVLSAAASSTSDSVRTQADSKTRAEIEVDDSEILQNTTGAGDQLVIERDDVTIIFTRDARGALKLCVEGERHSKSQLRQIGEEVLGRVTQQYVYNRVISELAERHMTVVDEHVAADQSVRIRVRNS